MQFLLSYSIVGHELSLRATTSNHNWSRKKSYFLSAPTIKGGGVKAGPLKKKNFFEALNKRKKDDHLARGGGVSVLVVGPLRTEHFLRLPLDFERDAKRM